MNIFKLIRNKRWQKRNYIILKEIVSANMNYPSMSYEKPILPELTQEEIDDIHSRGKITAAEMIEDCEWINLCAPEVAALGSSTERCKMFQHNCHDCLVDFVKDNKEYYSLYDVVNPFKIDDVEDIQKIKKKIDDK